MSKHCDFCLVPIDEDKKAIKIERSYILWRNERDREDWDKLELCGNCGTNVKMEIAKIRDKELGKLPPEVFKLFQGEI